MYIFLQEEYPLMTGVVACPDISIRLLYPNSPQRNTAVLVLLSLKLLGPVTCMSSRMFRIGSVGQRSASQSHATHNPAGYFVLPDSPENPWTFLSVHTYQFLSSAELIAT